MGALQTPWGLLLIAFCCAFFWRAAGTLLSGRVEVDTPVFDWCICVTQAIVGGLMVRAILWPSSGLAAVPLADRLASVVVAFAVFYVLRKNVFAGVVGGSLTLGISILWRSM